jgi:LmbE family N-acetylglucosaminyl deacetylase
MNPLSLLGKNLLLVTAHPDDESFLAAGLMHLNNLAGGKNSILCATCGEKGKGNFDRPVTSSQLKKIRKEELVRVSNFLKVNKLVCLNLPDGNLKFCTKELSVYILKMAKRIKPDVLMSFGKDGVSGHMDHITIGAITKKIAGKLKIPFSAFSAPPLYIKYFGKIIKSRRKFGVYNEQTIHGEYKIRLKIDPKVKEKALKFHKSQAHGGDPFCNMPASVGRQWLNYEYFS